MSTKIIMYATSSCPYCMMAKKLLTSKGVEFEVIDVGRDAALWEALREKSGGRNTVPQIFIGDHHVGGYDDLSAADRSGELDKLLEGVK